MSCEAQQKITMHVAIKSLHELKMEKMLHKMLIINPKEIRHSDVCSGNSGWNREIKNMGIYLLRPGNWNGAVNLNGMVYRWWFAVFKDQFWRKTGWGQKKYGGATFFVVIMGGLMHRSPQLKKIKTEKKLKILEKNWKKTEKKLKKLKYKNAIFSTVYVEKFRFLLVCGKTDTKANFCPKDIILVAPVWAQYSKL